MTPKDKETILKKVRSYTYSNAKSGVWWRVYWGSQAGKIWGEGFKEYLKALSPIHDHINISGHTVTIEDFSILAREDQNLLRTIKEAIYIRAK